MVESLRQIIQSYDADRPLDRAETIPSLWYTDSRVYQHEVDTVFRCNWLPAARLDQLAAPGSYATAHIAGQPIVMTRAEDGALHAFYNVCRHHAAQVAVEPAGTARVLRCPYHGWTYGLDGALKGAPEFAGACGFDATDNGLLPVRVATWAQFVFVCLDDAAAPLDDHLGTLPRRCADLDLPALRFHERRSYTLNCNWKVFVDDLDGGYHVPHVHKSLASVLDYSQYTIENDGRLCTQASPIDSGGGDGATAEVRGGDMAYYFWLHPTFMLNWYEGIMDTNVVVPLGVDRTEVIFDFFFSDSHLEEAARGRSIEVGERIQQEDIDICESVQRGLSSRAYDTGRLSVRREAGEHLFHRLLHADLSTGL